MMTMMEDCSGKKLAYMHSITLVLQDTHKLFQVTKISWTTIKVCCLVIGYSISSGVYFPKNQKRYHAIGAPRGSAGNGKVLIIDVKNTENIIQLSGSKFGSYFGSELASIDLNGDGYDELLVGAPMHNSISYDEGCVFVFSKVVQFHYNYMKYFHEVYFKLTM